MYGSEVAWKEQAAQISKIITGRVINAMKKTYQHDSRDYEEVHYPEIQSIILTNDLSSLNLLFIS
jgi:hypothetical protein